MPKLFVLLIVQQQVPEYNSNGLLLIQTNFVYGTSN